jgi:hypothetical protein
MKIEPRNVKIRDLVVGYEDNGEGGVTALTKRLDVRPPYQREFVYKDKQRNAVIETIINGFPLNVMYFAVREDGTEEVMDGQQRIISICQYVSGDFSHLDKSFSNLASDIQSKILDYELLVYHCEGTPSEKLEWFRVINIAGERLTDQELRNAVYHGPWLTDAKKWFSRTGGPAISEGDGYINGSPIRQEILEMALEWICARDALPRVETYMDLNRGKTNASELWNHFSQVINWAKTTFPVIRRELKSVKWGDLFLEFSDDVLDPDLLEARIKSLMVDEEVTSKSGIYNYVLDGKERHLSIRAFSDKSKTEAFERQKGICANPSYSGHDVNDVFPFEKMEADHITPWSQGGKSTSENCQMLCQECNRRKGSI